MQSLKGVVIYILIASFILALSSPSGAVMATIILFSTGSVLLFVYVLMNRSTKHPPQAQQPKRTDIWQANATRLQQKQRAKLRIPPNTPDDMSWLWQRGLIIAFALCIFLACAAQQVPFAGLILATISMLALWGYCEWYKRRRA